jgi:hypothetical protein
VLVAEGQYRLGLFPIGIGHFDVLEGGIGGEAKGNESKVQK